MAIIPFTSISEIRERHKEKTIVFCSGVFDLLHPGHVTFLEACKAEGDILVVMVGDDASVQRYKGNKRPILPHEVRVFMLNALRCVDYCFIAPAPSDNLLGFVDRVLQILRPDTYVVQEGAFDMPQRLHSAKKHDVRLVILSRPVGSFSELSTSWIIKQVLMSEKK